jgi:hypothetical protein
LEIKPAHDLHPRSSATRLDFPTADSHFIRCPRALLSIVNNPASQVAPGLRPRLAATGPQLDRTGLQLVLNWTHLASYWMQLEAQLAPTGCVWRLNDWNDAV